MKEFLKDSASNKKSLYFVFQGLFFSMLALFLFFYQGGQGLALGLRWAILSWGLGSLLFLIFSPTSLFGKWYFQSIFFIGDILAASPALLEIRQGTNLELIYLFIVLGTVLASQWKQTLAVGVIASILYVVSFHNGKAMMGSEFWLRLEFLITATALMTILSFDAQENELKEQERRSDWALKEARLSDLTYAASELAHRIKGPLSSILVNADVLSARPNASATREIQEIREEVIRCREILSRIMDLGRGEKINSRSFDLGILVKRAVKSFGARLRAKKINCEILGEEGEWMVLGDEELIEQSLSALIDNAIDAVGLSSGRITIRLLRRNPALFSWEKTGCLVIIEDNGRGISPQDMGKIFTPFFTTKGEMGNGLGLASAWRIAQKHGGNIQAQSQGLGRGSRFVLTFPQP